MTGAETLTETIGHAAGGMRRFAMAVTSTTDEFRRWRRTPAVRSAIRHELVARRRARKVGRILRRAAR